MGEVCVITRKIICHDSEGAYAYLANSHRLIINLKAEKEYLRSCEFVYGDPWEPVETLKQVPMDKVAMDEFFDYFNVSIEVPASRRLWYAFFLDDGNRKFWFTAAGFHSKRPEAEEMGLPFFLMPYIRESEVFVLPNWAKKAVFYQIFPDRFKKGNKTNHQLNSVSRRNLPTTNEAFYGGNLNGVIESLSYLSDLGINAIYLTPIFSSPSTHKYDTTDYYKIDPQFGDTRTLQELIRKCHEKDIKVILDGVFDHCGYEFWAFQDVVKNGKLSKHKDWFRVYSFPIMTDPVATYETWGKNIWHMPRFVTSNPEVKEYLLDVAAYWIKEADIDGWRLDTAAEIDHEFWRDLRKVVKATKPEALLIGEISQSASAWLWGDQLDSIMNYSLREIIIDFFASNRIRAEEFDARLARLRMQYYLQVNQVLYNLVGSHDTPRFLSICGGDKKKMKLALMFHLTYAGMPALYYGDEIGMKSISDKDCRQAMIWERKRQDLDLLSFCKKLIAIRKSLTALTEGDYVTVHANSKKNTYAYVRSYENELVLVALNNSSRKQHINIKCGGISEADMTTFQNMFTGQKLTAKNGVISLPLEPKTGEILKNLATN